jgi:hypothetical protein
MHIMHNPDAMLSLRVGGSPWKSQSDSTWYARLHDAPAFAQLRARPPAQRIRGPWGSSLCSGGTQIIVTSCKSRRSALLLRSGRTLPTAHMHPVCIAQRTCSLRAAQSAQMGRSALESRVSVCTRSYRPNTHELMAYLPHTAGSVRDLSHVKLPERVSFAS